MPKPQKHSDTAPSRHLEWTSTNPKIGALLVTYNPELDGLERLLRRLLPQADTAVVVDNGSDNIEQILSLVDHLESKEQVGPIGVILNEDNSGIASAQNDGIEYLVERDCDLVVLSDQDSLPEPLMVEKLYKCLVEGAATAASGKGAPVAAVGPVPIDARGAEDLAMDGGQPGPDVSSALVYSFTKWGPRRRDIPQRHESQDVPFVLASGCMIPTKVLKHVGPMNESLFIDHVDLAWCMRAVSMGYRILVCGDAFLEHSLGEDRKRLLGGRKVHVQSVGRNYYMVRNTLFLTRAPFMPWRWRAGYIAYLTRYLGFYALAGLTEPKRWASLAAGVRDGLLGRGGPRP